jgi:tRNA(fMet)-specific endonuclease VapC
MIYFLDTNICIYHLNNTNHALSERLEEMPTSNIKIPSMVAAELLFGAEKSVKREHNLKVFKSFLSIYEIINFDGRAAEHYSMIRADLERRGQIIGGNDMIIAATALASGGILITHDTDEFSRIKQLKTEDWTV